VPGRVDQVSVGKQNVRDCSVARTLEVVGERWTILAVREIMLGNRRFEAIVRYTGAPRDILSARLRKLVEDGLVERVEYQTRPSRHEYRMTGLGWSLAPVVDVLRAWGDEHLSGESGPPVRFLHRCGEDYVPEVVCASCGSPSRPADLRPTEDVRS
jgi:DNA-binding HxlR family transcriptional regulator